MRAILVDDEPVILEELKLLLENNENIEVVGAYTDSLKVLQELSITRPDCAFLDIEMVGLSGIELAEKLAEKNPAIEVLFITAYNHYATQAFEVNAIDYILKPIRPVRLAKALEKIYKKQKLEKPLAPLLKIRSFGTFEVFVGETPIKWSRAKPRELFAYLLQNEGKWVEKYKVCDDLWREHEPEQALANLQTAVWAIRKTMNEVGCAQVKISYKHDRYMLQLLDAVWDLQQFDRVYRAFANTGSLETVRTAERLYSGEYLSGEDWLWSDVERESYACRYEKLKRILDNTAEKYFL